MGLMFRSGIIIIVISDDVFKIHYYELKIIKE